MNKKANMGVTAILVIGLIAIFSLIAIVQWYDTQRALALVDVVVAQKKDVCLDACYNTAGLAYSTVNKNMSNQYVCQAYCSKYDVIE